MSKNKLAKFADMDRFPNVLQFPYKDIAQGKTFEYRGRWNELFGNGNPIILELGCGRGEYTIGLAALRPDMNFVGIDIKGARMWAGAKAALQLDMRNVMFLRTEIEFIDRFFAPGEVSEIWITFPDPQMQKVRKRLTSTKFIGLYLRILKQHGIINLKTDSNFLFTYTKLMVGKNNFKVVDCIEDVHKERPEDGILAIRTAYETLWLQRGLTIKFISFVPESRAEFIEPDEKIPFDEYRSVEGNKEK